MMPKDSTLPSKMKRAKSSSTDYVTLRDWAKSPNPWLRAAIAGNTNTQNYVLDELSSDRSSTVRLSLASNPNLPQKAWDKLKDDSSEKVKQALWQVHPERPSKLGHRA